MTAAELAARLDAKRDGDGWRATCPAHDDGTPSLTIKDGRLGVLVHCHAGCSQAAVLAALPVEARELFAEPAPSTRREVATYDYHDEHGTLLYQSVRLEPGENGAAKTFRMRRPDSTAPGGWDYHLNGTRRVLYRLPELLAGVQAGKRVWIVEGEKDADALRERGQIATTNPNGAGKWRPDYTAALHGADVVIVADRDAPGYAHARDVERHLKGIAAKVVVMESATDKDISDHLAAGHKLRDLVPMATPRLPDPTPPSATDADGFIRVGDLVAEADNPHPWVVHGLVPSGGLVLVAAKPKVGKSTLTRAVALRVCRGEPVLGRETMQGPVLYLGLEDPREAIKGHFRRMGANSDDDLRVYTGQVPEHAQAWLADQLAKRDPVLVVIDTMQFYLGVADLNDYAQVVTALRSILALVRGKSRAAVMVVHHAGKGDRVGFDAVLGSTGITGTADTTILLRRRPDDQSRTIATQQRMHAPGGEDMPETVLNLDERTEPKLAGTRAEYDLDKMAADILAYLTKTAGEWQERKDVLAGVEGKTQLKVDVLDRAFRSGQVERQGGGKRGDPFLFRVSGTVSPTPEKPFFRSSPTVGTAERKPNNATSLDGTRANSVPVFPALRDSSRNAGMESAHLCPKGHIMQHKAGANPLEGWVCPTCYPDIAADYLAPRVSGRGIAGARAEYDGGTP